MKKFLLFLLLITYSLSAQQFKFAWLTDIHIGYPTAKDDLIRSVNDINSFDDIDFTIISGDITATGTLDELSEAKKILSQLKKNYYIIPGNHDTKWSESGCTDFNKLWGSDRFAFEYDKFLFIGLHQGPLMRMADGYFAPEDLRWFDSIIDTLSNSNMPIIFITHYPLNESIANWYEMIDRLKKLNTEVVLFGHEHKNKFYDFDGITGVGSRANLSSNNDGGGYNIVTVKNDSMFFDERVPLKNINLLWKSIPLKKKLLTSLSSKINSPDFLINKKYPYIKTVWEFNTGYTIGSSAAIDNKSVYVGDASGNFYALNLKNGSVIWTFKTHGAIYSTPAIKEQKIVFGSADSSIYCLNTLNGKLIWKFKTNAAVLGCPIIENDIVFIGGSDRIFRAINLETGKLVWDFKGLNGFVETKPAYYNGKIYFGAWDENFYCLNSKTGKLLWKWKGDRSGIFYSPAAVWAVVTDGIVFIAAPDRKLTALNAETGNQLWRTGKYEVRETLGLAEDGNKLFIRTINDTILALLVSDKLTSPLWITNCGFGYDISSAQIVEKDDNIFYATKNGMIYSLNAKNGNINWQHKISNGYINTISPLSNKEIITTGFDGKVTLIKVDIFK